ncbi:MAG: S8 family serine peptidase, partial [Gammaproteobacteria bacterium]
FASGEPFPAEPRDPAGHGSRIAAIVAEDGGVELLDARIFGAGLRTDAARAAAAIDWLVAEGARILNLSLGLREDREVLRDACARAVAAGALLVASSPARGGKVFPAAYPGVLRATGDARCAPGEISWLGSTQADAGGHVRSLDGEVAGASMGCARVTAALARWLGAHPGASNADAITALRVQARYIGPERR